MIEYGPRNRKLEDIHAENVRLRAALKVAERYFLIKPEVHRWKLEQIRAALEEALKP